MSKTVRDVIADELHCNDHQCGDKTACMGTADSILQALRGEGYEVRKAPTCIYEARSRINPLHHHQNVGATEVATWCQTHGWNCPNLTAADGE